MPFILLRYFLQNTDTFSPQVWREACQPLYNYRCCICERAIARVKEANDAMVVASQPVPSHATTTTTITFMNTETYDAPDSTHQELWVVQLVEEETAGADSVVSLVYTEGEQGYYTDGKGRAQSVARWRCVKRCEPGSWSPEARMRSTMASMMMIMTISRRRTTSSTCRAGPSTCWHRRRGRGAAPKHATGREGTPPKQQRVGERVREVSVELGAPMIKRRSEELDAEDSEDSESRHSAGSVSKRARVDLAESPPDSTTPGSESVVSTSGYDSPALGPGRPTVRTGAVDK
jgi:hypothetical protein